MTDLSPAAQAVFAASHTDPQVVADILLAVADQVVPEFWHEDEDTYGWTMQDIRKKLLTIAAHWSNSMTDYKATPEQWEAIAKYAKDLNSGPACLLELRARVEALEAGQRPASKVYEISKPLKLTAKQQQELNALLRPVTSQPSPNSSQIGSSLMERVEDALMESIKDQNSMARAAIREVAAWMTSNADVYFPPALVFALEKEAEQ